MPKQTSLLQSFRASYEGLMATLDTERNMRLHMVSALVAIILGAIFNLSEGEWLALVIVIGLVFCLELLNTALEYLLDTVIGYHHPRVKLIKDITAATVLIAALTAAIVGAIIFIPKILAFFALPLN